MRGNIVFLLVITITLTGCATMSKKECLVADWQGLGFEDGAFGRHAAYIGERRKACAEHGIAVNRAAYEAGYNQGILVFCSFDRGRRTALSGFAPYDVCPSHSEFHEGFAEGLKNFCTYQSGYDHGLAGRGYRRTCPAKLENTFLQGYDAGSYVHSLQNQLADLQAQLQELEIHRDDNKQQQKELKQQLILDGDLNSEERARILLDIDTLRDESDEVKRQKKEVLMQIREVQLQLREVGVDV